MSYNPFSDIVRITREDNKIKKQASYRFGTVIKELPLAIDVNGTVQEGKDLLKNAVINDLKEGDKVFLIPVENEQKYVVLCKVV